MPSELETGLYSEAREYLRKLGIQSAKSESFGVRDGFARWYANSRNWWGDLPEAWRVYQRTHLGRSV